MPTVTKNTTDVIDFDNQAPDNVKQMYAQSMKKHTSKGKDKRDAHKSAISDVQNAGFYKGQDGWKQLHPDIRGKVTSRDAVMQPDGTYVIEDVPVFYPNAVKGKNMAFPAEDIRQIIDNTNRGINAGGQKPSLLEGHTVPEHTLLGKQLDAQGFGVNWREDDNRPGWAVCDLIGIPANILQRVRDKKLTGLSAGIARDSDGLNRRFGHVALLGGTTQALSLLPTLDIHSSSVCFSADETTILKGNKMKTLNPKQQEHMKKLTACYAAYESAKSSFEAGEPGADKKMDESCANLESAHANYWGEMSPKGPATVSPGPSEQPTTYSGPIPLTTVSDNNPATVIPMEHKNFSFAADPAGAFDALREQYSTEIESLKNDLEMARVVMNSLVGQREKDKFDAEVNTLKAAGVPVPSNIDEQFSSCLEHTNPKSALTTLIEGLRSMPKGQTPATAPTLFAAGGGNIPVETKVPVNTPKKFTPAEIKKTFGRDVTDTELSFGALGDAATFEAATK